MNQRIQLSSLALLLLLGCEVAAGQETPPAAATDTSAPGSEAPAGATQDETPVDPAAAPDVTPPPQPYVDTIPVQSTEPAAQVTDDQPTALEVVIVTAQKRPQSLREVPISMSVLDDKLIERQGISDLQDASAYIPNANINSSPFLPDIRIRGFGSEPLNKAFEQSVGLVLDGVPYGRAQYFQAALFDVERIEALRGPQGTLFGKNTSAGVFNIVTRDPSPSFSGSLSTRLGDLRQREFQAAASGPIVEDLVNFRLAAVLDQRQGYVENTTARTEPQAASPLGGRDRKALRFKLGLPDLFGADAVLSYEKVDVALTGAPIEMGLVPQNLVDFYRRWDPRFDALSGNYVGSLDRPVESSIHADTWVANIHDDVGEWGVSVVAGYSSLSVVERADLDVSPAPMIWSDPRSDDNALTTAELRFESPHLDGLFGLGQLFGTNLGSSDLIAGVFHQRNVTDHSRETMGIDSQVVSEFLAAQGGTAPPAPPSSGSTQEISTLFFDQSSNADAVFAQGDWRFTERWALQLGMRYSQETKQGHWRRVFDTQPNLLLRTALGFQEFTADLKRSESALIPKVGLQYAWSDDTNLFASWSKGFKAGGFNAWLTASADPDRLQFRPERVNSWELGTKSRWFDGALAADVSLFWMDLKDFQALTASPNNVEQYVANAAKARARGLEGDLRWLASSWLNVRAAVGFNDSMFLDFPFGDCAPDRPDTDGDGDPRCNLSGQPLFRTPKWTTTLTPVATIPLGDLPGLGAALPTSIGGLYLVTGLNIEYQSSKYVARFRDPRALQPSFVRYDVNISLQNPTGAWSAGLSVKNLTDQLVLARRDDVALSADAGGEGAYWQLLEPPRLFLGHVQVSF